MKPQVSVIVPVYNVEKYLDKCLDSLVKQTLESIEIIVVNDGSPDQSQMIIDAYTQRYPHRVFSYIKENGGLADARNFGLAKAQGEYIGFIDSDDTVELDLYQSLLECALAQQSDLVVCDLEYVYENDKPAFTMAGYSPKLNRSIRQSIFLGPLFAWNKLYKKSLFDSYQLKFPVGLWYEDMPVTVPLFALASKISYVPKLGIHYMQRSSSIMGSQTHPKMHDIFTVLNLIYLFYESQDFLSIYREEIEYLFIEHLMLYGSFRFMRSNDSEALFKSAFNVMKDKFPHWKLNPYLQTLKPAYRVYLRLMSPIWVKCIQPWIRRKGTYA